MKSSVPYKRIPTLFGLVLMIGVLSLTSFLIRGNLNFLSNAAPDTSPQHVVVTNVTSDAFSVTYTTANPALGAVQYGVSGANEKLANDERDSIKPENHIVHSIRLKALKPNTTYLFTLLSNGNTYTNGGTSYSVHTPAESPTNKDTSITGSVATPDQLPIGEAIVVLTGDTIQSLSAIVKPDGTFMIPLQNLLGKDLFSPPHLSPTTKLTLTVRNGAYVGTVTTIYSQTHPVPLMTLSQQFDFTADSTLFMSRTGTSSADLSALPASTTTKQVPQQPTIIAPYKDQRFTDAQPSFSGNGLPFSAITITIQSTSDITTTVKADAAGSWKYRPTKSLTPGNHTITITGKDAFGIMKTLQQPFVVLAAGSQVDAAPSVAPTKSPTASITPSATSVPTPTTIALVPTTITPTQAVTPTILPTAAPTNVPTPIPTLIARGPTLTPAPLERFQTGSSMSLIVAVVSGIITAVGLTLFVLSRGSTFL